MKRNTLLLSLVLILFIPVNTSAQVGKLLKKKLKEATQSVSDDKKEENKDEARPGKALMGLLGGGEAAYDQNYDFQGRVILEMTVYDDNGEDESVIEYNAFFNKTTGNASIDIKPVSGEAAQSDMSVMTMIFDQLNKSAVMLTSQGKEKTAIITSLDIVEGTYEEDIEDPDMPSYVKTGRTRTISGYKCEEYKYTDEETSMSMWVTDDIQYNVDNKQMKKAGVPVWYSGEDGTGMMIEMESFEDDRLVMKMLVKDIDMNFTKSVSLDGYMIMNVGEGY